MGDSFLNSPPPRPVIMLQQCAERLLSNFVDSCFDIHVHAGAPIRNCARFQRLSACPLDALCLLVQLGKFLLRLTMRTAANPLSWPFVPHRSRESCFSPLSAIGSSLLSSPMIPIYEYRIWLANPAFVLSLRASIPPLVLTRPSTIILLL